MEAANHRTEIYFLVGFFYLKFKKRNIVKNLSEHLYVVVILSYCGQIQKMSIQSFFTFLF